jgi:hypothetical protein
MISNITDDAPKIVNQDEILKRRELSISEGLKIELRPHLSVIQLIEIIL